MALFAHSAGLTAFAVKLPWERKSLQRETADKVAEALALDMTAHWWATTHAYFGRVSKQQILEEVREAVSEDVASRPSSMKKAAMTEAAEQLLAGTGWLPPLLRTPSSEPGSPWWSNFANRYYKN